MWYLKYVANGRTVEENYETLEQAKRAYTNNLSRMEYGAIYEANNAEEMALANDLFEASENEITRREEQVIANFLTDNNLLDADYDW